MDAFAQQRARAGFFAPGRLPDKQARTACLQHTGGDLQMVIEHGRAVVLDGGFAHHEHTAGLFEQDMLANAQ